MRRIILLVSGALCVLTLSAVPALANGNGAETFTFHTHKQTFGPFVDVVPCANGDIPASITTVENSVIHVTVRPGGSFNPDTFEGTDFSVTGTFTGTFRAVTAAGTYAGHFTTWFGGAVNDKNAAFTATFSVHGRTPTGERFGGQFVEHFNSSASIPPHFNEFVKSHCTGP
jgi:hypothetical protein